MKKEIVYGDRWIEVELPDNTEDIPPSINVSLPLPAQDVEEAVKSALDKPVVLPPIEELVNRDSRVTIAFDDPTVASYAGVWEAAITEIVDRLTFAGVKIENIFLIGANGLHRKFTHRETAAILGEKLVQEFSDRLFYHDAEDKENLLYLGKTPNGYEVELNKFALESDLLIYVNTFSSGFSGGWKSINVGLGSWRSIRHHHKPDIMSMTLGKNLLHEILNEMGSLVKEKFGKRKIYKIETLLSNPFQVGKIWAGDIDAVRSEALKLMKKHQKLRRELVNKKFDIICYGVPSWSPYAAFTAMNPFLAVISTGLGYMGGMINVVAKENSTVILAYPVEDKWDDYHFPNYREVWEKILPETKDPYYILDRYVDYYLRRNDLIHRYRFEYAFHPLHVILGTFPLKKLQHIGELIVAAPIDGSVLDRAGFRWSESVEEAIEYALKKHGDGATIGCINNPAAFSRTF